MKKLLTHVTRQMIMIAEPGRTEISSILNINATSQISRRKDQVGILVSIIGRLLNCPHLLHPIFCPNS